jgi:two-component system OmpR family response regulator
MNLVKHRTLFLVDDDAIYLKLLEIEFMQYDFTIESFLTGEDCIKNMSHKPDIIILDFHLDSVNRSALSGISTLDKIKEFNINIPVVMLSAEDRVDVAVNCISHKAFDYVVKSETAFLRLERILCTIFPGLDTKKELLKTA